MNESRSAATAPVDLAARGAALDVHRSFIVQAPAGSGKTELLTQRFLKLLSIVEKPERVLAITFTRKATQEMRNRIMERLRQARENSPVEPHERQAVGLAAAVLARNEQFQWGLLQNPGRLRIFTIDALCTQLLLRDPEYGPVAGQLQVLEDARPLYRLAIRRMMEDLETATGPELADENSLHECLVRVLVHLDGDMHRLEDMLMQMLAIRDQWTDSLGQPEERLQHILHFRQIEEQKAFADTLGHAPLATAMDIISGIGTRLEDTAHPASLLAASARENPGRADLPLWQSHWLARLLTTQNNTARGPGGITGKRLFPQLDEEYTAPITELKAIYSRWHEDPAAIHAIERMAKSAPLDSQPLWDGLLQDVLGLLRFLLAELNLVIQSEARTDFQFLAEKALFSLGGTRAADETYSDVLLTEDNRLDHLLLDEFQDTSQTQHRLIKKLIGGWTAGDGRTLFLVGDPMQSIYRFREADVGLFTRVVQQRRLGGVPVEVLKLTANFRSRNEIIGWINRHFPSLFPARDDRDSGAVRYHSASAERAGGGVVQLHVMTPDETEEHEARQIAALVRACREEDGDSRIAVLVRVRDHLSALARELSRSKIEFEAVKVNALGELPVIQDLLAITRALLQPADRVAAAALLRAPWCGLQLPLLHRITGERAEDDVWQRVRCSLEDDEIPGDVRERLNKLGRVVETARGLTGQLKLVELVEFAWLQLGGPYVYADSDAQEHAVQFLDLLGRVEQGGQNELAERLNDAMEGLYAQGKPASVQLMTIHQAKGLEFDVVILPGLHRTSGRSDPPLIMAQQFSLVDAAAEDGLSEDCGLLMAAITRRGWDGPSIYRYLSAVESERQRHESIRLLYVAATRARKQLHLFGRFRYSKQKGCYASAGSFLEMLTPAFQDALDGCEWEPGDQPDPQQEPVTLPLLRLEGAPEIMLEWPDVRRSEPATPPILPDRDAVALGEALHLWLELIHDHWQKGWTSEWFAAHGNMLASLLRRTGADPARIPELLPRLVTMIRGALESDAGGFAIAPEGKAESHAELPFCRKEGNRAVLRIIDRLYREGDGAWQIVDYKTGGSDEERQKKWSRQLGEYASLVRETTGLDVSACSVYQAEECRLIPLHPVSGEESIGGGEGVPA